MSLRILCDFDGTISVADTTDAIFDRFAPSWRVIEALWEGGEIGSAECMRRQIELMDVSAAELDEALDGLEIDPTFTGFVRFCDAAKIELSIISDGVDYFIRRILENAGLAYLPVRANQLIPRGLRRYTLAHPHQRQDCETGAGTCKCAQAGAGGGSDYTILIGDGRSDFCLSHRAGAVFAKKGLLNYTAGHGIPALEYSSFADVQTVLEGLLRPCQPGRSTANTLLEVSA
jgi:2-hydroxy-3-keto-5-methylthiopentenyl-1-phosphate phosphatase